MKQKDFAASSANTKGPSVPDISLPKGGGAITGIGEKFKTNPVTGTASFQVPVKMSASRNGFQPELTLSYDSGNGNGAFGLGWSIGIPSISRKTQKGLPVYDDQNESDVFLIAGAEDLVPQLELKNEIWQQKTEEKNGFIIFFYRPRTEGAFSRIQRWHNKISGISHWQVKTKDNVTNVFGMTESARIYRPGNDEQVFQWFIERSFDDKGNCIEYEYKREDSAGVPIDAASEQHRKVWCNCYLKRVRYGNTIPVNRLDGVPEVNCKWIFELVLDYGEHSLLNKEEDRTWLCRKDPHSDYRAGFEIRTYRLCRRLLMFHHFKELGDEPYLVASTNLSYNETPALTVLHTVQHWSYEKGKEPAAFPPLDFQYSKPTLAPADFFEIDERDPVSGKIDLNRIQWTDLFGEGISGLLYEDDHSWWYKRNVSGAENEKVEFSRFLKIAERPALAGNKSGGQLTDIDGDGTLDLLVRSNGISGFFEQEDLQWKNFKSFAGNPNINWKDPNLRSIDLTGDGHADIIISEEQCFTWYESKTKKGFGDRHRESIPFDSKGPELIFNDGTQSIYLSDMSGDGLTDIVRIRNGEICYWPNLGYGKFGNKIQFDHAPHFDHPDRFDQKRIRLADIDGSGTTDVLYICSGKISYWINQCGNSFSDEINVTSSGSFDNLSQIQTVDLLGKGTSCLVISNPASGKLRYIDLMASGKPYLLQEVNNNIGAVSRYYYSSSTKFYRNDERNGTPWITKLPFPVHVVEKTETLDLIGKTSFTTRYAYHHGYYDGTEREFRGFGMVEQWDSESYEEHLKLKANGVEAELFSPPIHTKSWFHTGFFKDKEKILGHYAGEYYRGDSQAWTLTQPVVSSDLEPDEIREAARAFKGSVLRQEVYAQDGSEKEQHPYTVTTYNYEVRQLQPKGKNKFSVFHLIPTEALTYNYERNPDDPRIGHQLNLEIDAFGHVTQSIAVSYPRRKPEFKEQDQLLAVLKNEKVINVTDQPDWYRLGMAYQNEEWEIAGLPFSGKILQAVTVKAALNKAVTIPYEDKPKAGVIIKREVSEQRVYFYNEELNDRLPFGDLAFHALPYDTCHKALTPSLIQTVYGNRLTESMLTDAGYLFDENAWWQPSGKIIFDAAHFYQPVESIDPLGNRTKVEHDDYRLFPLKSTDAVGNQTQAFYDYRVLQTKKTTDANGNHHSVAFDTRGSVIATAVTGKNGEGDSLDSPTSRLEYELFNWQKNRKPNYVKTFAREVHKDPQTPWQISLSYSNGLGKEILKKVQAEDGEAFSRNKDGSLRKGKRGNLLRAFTAHRWVGNGRVILNNKGKPVKQYEPYFTDTSDYEDENELREYGVTPVIHYDPVDRVIRTDLPDGTFSKTEFDGWKKATFDANDTVFESAWYSKRKTLAKSSPDYRAAQLAAAHANTPHVEYFDSLGRSFASVEDNGASGKYTTLTEFDIEGKPRRITDAKKRVIARYQYDIAGKQIYSWMADAGERWIFYSLFSEKAKEEGKEDTPLPLITWDNSDFTKRMVYDQLHRVKQTWLTEQQQPEKLIAMSVFGEEHPDALSLNLRGKTWMNIDQSGLTQNCLFDFKGNALETKYRPAREYKQTIDWQFLATVKPTDVEDLAAPKLETDIFRSFNTFDALNRVTSSVHPDGSEIKSGYNKAGLLESVSARLKATQTWTSFVNDINYDEKGQRTAIWYGNGTKTSYEYDPKNFRLTRLLTTRKSDNAFLQDLYYTYDATGNITGIKDKAQQTVFFNNAKVDPDAEYEYDALYRLLKAEGRELAAQPQTNHSDSPIQPLPQPGNALALKKYTQTYSFDELGNILSMTHKSVGGNWTRTYKYKKENNHLLETSGVGKRNGKAYFDKYTHDAHGNMTDMPHLQNIAWNYNDQMREVNLRGGGIAFYVYNSGGNRTRKIIERLDGTVEERFYAGSFEVYRERRNEVVDLERETLFIGDDKHRIAQVDTQTIENRQSTSTRTIRYQFTNHLGSASLELDENAAIISYEEYHPFGTSAYRAGRNEAEVKLKRYRYTGKERDDETGMGYHNARYYLSWLGRWLNSDPIGFNGGLNLYAYVHNNPIMLHDPQGTNAQGNNWGMSYINDSVSMMSGTSSALNYSAVATASASINYCPVETPFMPTGPMPEFDWQRWGIGSLQMLGCIGEGLGTAALCVAPDPTMLTKVGCGIGIVHTADTCSAAILTLTTGTVTDTLAHKAGESMASHLGASPAAATWWGVGFDIFSGSVPALLVGATRSMATKGMEAALVNKSIASVSNEIGVIQKARWGRGDLMGATPKKFSEVGKKVILKAHDEGKIRFSTTRGMEFMDSNEVWHSIAEADMSHKRSAVTWWNIKGEKFGAKSTRVRHFMNNPNNYYLELFSINRSEGARMGITYKQPISW